MKKDRSRIASHYKGDTAERIKSCLNCPLPRCIDCFARGGQTFAEAMAKIAAEDNRKSECYQKSKLNAFYRN